MSEALDAITDKVLAYRPEQQPLKVIAGTPDTPLVIGDIQIPCYVLEDETRVVSQRGVTAGIGLNPGAGFRMPQFMASRGIAEYVSPDSGPALNRPILFKNPAGGGNVYGYPATLLTDICGAVLASRRDGRLSPSHTHIAERCEVLLQGLAKVGIIALVDEATGYQYIREERALATILERFIAKDLQRWTRTFPYVFYEQIFRLKGWGSAEGVNRPSVIGHYTNDFVYARLAPGILDELRKRNPLLPHGWRRNRHHQWFTEEYGHSALKDHLLGVVTLMRGAATWDGFKRSLDRAYPKINTTMAMPLDED